MGQVTTKRSNTITSTTMNIATISAGFEKGDFLVREEQGNRVYFDFFEEAFNYIANKGYARMNREDEKHWVDLMNVIHDSVKGGMKYNTGTLLMVLSRDLKKDDDKKDVPVPEPYAKEK